MNSGGFIRLLLLHTIEAASIPGLRACIPGPNEAQYEIKFKSYSGPLLSSGALLSLTGKGLNPKP